MADEYSATNPIVAIPRVDERSFRRTVTESKKPR
jgi:hypothetical protein